MLFAAILKANTVLRLPSLAVTGRDLHSKHHISLQKYGSIQYCIMISIRLIMCQAVVEQITH